MNKIMIDGVTNKTYNLLKWLKANVSTDIMSPALQCIHIKENGTIFEASDGFKLIVAKLQNPIDELWVLDNPQNKLTDGLWKPVIVTKKVIELVKVDDLIYPDTSIILTDYDKPITDTQTFTTLNPEFLCSVISGFDLVNINFITSNRPVQIVLHSISMPIGTYVAIVMPYRSDANFTTIQSDIRAVKDK